MKIVQEEPFAPILYVISYKSLDETLALHNGVPQSLNSAFFLGISWRLKRSSRRRAATAASPTSTSGLGAEIGGVFGGEKETGGGRESGSDSWKAYMRHQTNTINYTTELPLAQGIKFGE